MALQNNELFSSRDIPQSIRQVVKHNAVADFAAGTALLAIGTPMAFSSASSLWVPYTQPSDAAVYTITADATPATAGTFDLLIDGLVIEVAFDATAAQIQTAVNAVLAAAGKDYTVVGVQTSGTDLGDASAVVTITFGESAGAPSVDVDVDDLTGNAHVLAATNAGTALSGTNRIRAFVCHGAVQLEAGGEVKGTLQLAGEIHRDDVNTAAIRALLGGVPSEGELDSALGDSLLRDAGIMVRGLSNVPN